MRRRTAIVLLALLSAQFIALGALEAWRDSLTDDEGIYLAAGVTALTRHDLRINQETPPLPKVIAAAPALLAQPVIPSGRSWTTGDSFEFGDEFIAAQRHAGKLQRIVFLSRLPALAEAVLAAVLLYCIGASLFGRAAGVLAAALWLTAPFVLGLGHLDSQDLAFTVSMLAILLALLRHIERPTVYRLAVVAGLCAVGLLVRSTALLLVPVVAVLVVAAQWRRGVPRALVGGAVVLLVAWAGVWLGIRAIAPSAPPAAASVEASDLVRQSKDSSRMARVVLAVPWPQEYEAGVAYLQLVNSQPAPAYLIGRLWTGARWWYWPVSLVMKFPATTVALLLIAPLGLRTIDDEQRRRVFLILAIPALVLGVFTLRQPAPIGLRYLLPVVALGLVAAGSTVRLGRPNVGRAVALIVVGVQVVALWLSYPTTLSWTAPPFRPAYRATADSNIDWGQDLARLAAWSENRTPEPYIAYVGPRGVGARELPGTRLLSSEPPDRIRGWVAVSARLLIVYDRDELSWLRAYCPVDVVGGSILVYRFAEPPTATPGPTVPRSPCNGEYSTRT